MSRFLLVVAWLLPTLVGSCSAMAYAPVEHLCMPEEAVIFSCVAAERVHSICASPDLGRTTGYMQYRGGSGVIDHLYPEPPTQPVQRFRYESLIGDAVRLFFDNDGKRHEFIEHAASGETEVRISDDEGRQISLTHCDDATHSLTLTSTLERFRALGIVK